MITNAISKIIPIIPMNKPQKNKLILKMLDYDIRYTAFVQVFLLHALVHNVQFYQAVINKLHGKPCQN